MEKFEKLTGIAAPMPLVNIDTDMIIPKQFLKTIKRSGLGVHAFDLLLEHIGDGHHQGLAIAVVVIDKHLRQHVGASDGELLRRGGQMR